MEFFGESGSEIDRKSFVSGKDGIKIKNLENMESKSKFWKRWNQNKKSGKDGIKIKYLEKMESSSKKDGAITAERLDF